MTNREMKSKAMRLGYAQRGLAASRAAGGRGRGGFRGAGIPSGARGEFMIFGHDFKYEIPAMDRLLGAAADTGIFFQDGSESVGYPGGSAFLTGKSADEVRAAHFNREVPQLQAKGES